MRLESNFIFVKCIGGEKKMPDGAKKQWCRVTLLDDEQNVVTTFAKADRAEVVYGTASQLEYGEIVTATFDVVPMFDGKGFSCALLNIKLGKE